MTPLPVSTFDLRRHSPPWYSSAPMLPTLADVHTAHERIARQIRRTPLLESDALSERCGGRVFLKCESLQRAGAFKIRGALNAVLLARETGRLPNAGVVTYSSGNHGQAVALAAKLSGVPAVIVVPEDILLVKKRAIESHGARVVACGKTSEERRVRGEAIAHETGALVIPPFDDADIIAGQGTVAVEILGEAPEVDVILVPVGGGGLIAGVALASRALKPSVEVWGVEPDTADSLRQALHRGGPVTIPSSTSVADGLRAVRTGVLCYEAARRFVHGVVTVSDDEILAAQRFLLEEAKLFVEPSGATAAAPLLSGDKTFNGRTVAVVLSGGNAEIGESLLPANG